MTDVVETRDALDRAIAADREAAHVGSLLAALRGDLDRARGDLETVRRRHALEEADVRRLEGVSFSAVLAAVRGSRTGELDRERAEEVAARYALQTGTERVAALESRREDLERRLATLGDTRARREERATAHAQALRAVGAVAGLEAVLDELTAVRAEAVEVDEAAAAGRRAVTELDRARDQLGSADSWSAYDTWFGGGMIASSIKHDRLDGAADRIRDAQAALAEFARELSDVREVARLRADLGISPTTRTFDVWFDNVFSDLSVRSRIKASLADVDGAAAAVRAALTEVTARGQALRAREDELRRERDALLSPRG